jgi:outer membrane receptor for ferrienterochelin and colicins
MRTLYTILILLLLPKVAFLQNAQLQGIVLHEGNPIAYAHVQLKGTSWGAITAEDGTFRLENIDHGKYELAISALGYQPYSREIDLAGGTLDLGTVELQDDVLGLQEVVITGAMKETFIKESPVKVDVITYQFLTRNSAPTNLTESIKMINGVQETVACGVCFTNSFSINGLPGAYTAVLIDGTPLYGNLSAVYGLNGIPTTFIERIEVIKGPNSTLYGSEAVAGVINVITKDPARQPKYGLSTMTSTHGESYGTLSFAPKVGKWNTYWGFDWGHSNAFSDANGDGFSDRIHLDRYTVFSKWSMQRPEHRRFNVFAKWYYEDRRNGVEQFLTNRAYRQIRGSDTYYGESIYTQRAELFGTYDLGTKARIWIDFAFNTHDQDSYYGADGYKAEQQIAFSNLIWNPKLNKHDLLIGLTNRLQRYDDNTVATPLGADVQYIPGIFVQDEWTVTPHWTVMLGSRLDQYRNNGPIFSPRLNLKFKSGDWTTWRFNTGTGFRLVNLFTEDHAFVTGQREVLIEEKLNPERSYNLSLNYNHVFTLGESQGVLDVDAFFTHFMNKIIPDYDTPGKIIYRNTAGYAQTRGINISLQQQFRSPLSYTLGGSLLSSIQRVLDDNGRYETRAIPFAPDWTALSVLNYRFKKQGITLAYTANWTGSMALPEVFDLDASGNLQKQPRPQKSPVFSIHNLQITKNLPKVKLELFGGIQNLLNYRQAYSPLVGFNDPKTQPGFSPYFDTAYAFSSIHGREFYLGMRWSK